MNPYTLIALEYPSDAASKAVYEDVLARGKDCSVWRTMTPEHDRWFILGLFHDKAEAASFDWAEGVPFEPTQDQKDWCIKRRLGRAFAAHASGERTVHEVRHYEPEGAPRIPAHATLAPAYGVGAAAGSVEPSLIPPDPPREAADCDVCLGRDWYPAEDGGWSCGECGSLYNRNGVLTRRWGEDG